MRALRSRTAAAAGATPLDRVAPLVAAASEQRPSRIEGTDAFGADVVERAARDQRAREAKRKAHFKTKEKFGMVPEFDASEKRLRKASGMARSVTEQEVNSDTNSSRFACPHCATKCDTMGHLTLHVQHCTSVSDQPVST
jgi:hypothetical protein